MKSKVWLFTFLMMILFSTFALSGCQDEILGVGDKLPDFELRNVEGGILTLDDIEGKVILIDFWATWCAPCRSSVPHLKKLHKDYEGKDFMVLGINLDKKKSDEEIARYAENEGIEYKIVKGTDEFFNKFGVRGIPAFFLIDKDSKISLKLIGYDPNYFKMLPAKIDNLLEE